MEMDRTDKQSDILIRPPELQNKIRVYKCNKVYKCISFI